MTIKPFVILKRMHYIYFIEIYANFIRYDVQSFFFSIGIIISDESKAILNRIDDFLHEVITDLNNGKKIEISVQNRKEWSNCLFEDGR